MSESGEGKKQVPLRIAPKLYNEIARWAEDDFRSVNGQIEFLLTECVRRRKSERTNEHSEADSAPQSRAEEDEIN